MKNFTRLSITACLFFAFSAVRVYGGIFYVKTVASGNASGSSWANASSSIQAMINAAASGDQIWVAAGTYLPTHDGSGNSGGSNKYKTFNLKNGVKMYGGFAGTETTLAERPAISAGIITVLSGDFNNDDIITGSGPTLSIANNTEDALHVVLSVNDGNTTLLDGFTVSGGYANGGGSQNVEGKTINTVNGGGMYTDNSSALINNCQFKGNRALAYGGGFYNFQSPVAISNSAFTQNNASAGAAICNQYSSSRMTNSVLTGNKSDNGTIFNYSSSSPAFINCTISGNGASGACTSTLDNGSNTVFTNCILWNSTSAVSAETFNVDGATGNASFLYCIVRGGIGGTGNSNGDPKFINAASPAGADNLLRTADDGLRLTNCSAGYNAGTATNAPLADILGVARPQFSTADIGAYESTVTVLTPPLLSTSVTTFSCTSTTLLAAGGDSYAWSGGATPAAASNTFTVNGTYSVEATNLQGCTATASVLVELAPVVSFTGATTGCGSVTLTSEGGVSYLWNGGSMPASATNTFNQSGTYSVTATAANTCTTTASQAVTVTIAPRIYVNGAVTASGNGMSWAAAFKTLQEALVVCGAREVWVAAGTYVPTQAPDEFSGQNREKTFYLSDGIKLYGGFAGTETLLSARNINTNLTILSGDLSGNDAGFTGNTENAYHVVTSISDDSSTVVDGFTIKGGNANSYNGMSVGSEYINTYEGGGMINYYSSPSVTNCTFLSNNAMDNGGAMNNNNSSAIISQCSFINNKTYYGGALSFYEGSPVVKNSVFTGNSANTGGAIYNSNSGVSIINCTLTNNTSTSGGAAIADESYSAVMIVRNCNIWGNTGTPGISSMSAPDITYSNVEGNSVLAGTGNVMIDPIFVNAALPLGADGISRTADDGLSLQNTSPLLDAGTDADAPVSDILGNNVYNLTKDIGAYEQMQGQAVYSSTPSCQSISVDNVSGNKWFYFRNASGIVAAINPNGTDMGTVTADISDASGTISYNSKNYISRSVDFTSSNYAPGETMPNNYSMRLYNYDTELAEYNTTTGSNLTINNLDVGWYQGGTGCDLLTYNGNASGTIDAATITTGEYGATNNGFYLQFSLDHFTLFAAIKAATILPVKLLSVTAVNKGSYNLVNWVTATEINNHRFDVQRSADGISFKRIGSIAGAINSNSIKYYQYTDNDPLTGTNYYRLQQVDADGHTSLSGIVTAKKMTGVTVSISPNPAQDQLFIKGIGPNTAYEITTALGQKVIRGVAITGMPINISALRHGIYFISADGQVFKFVKQ